MFENAGEQFKIRQTSSGLSEVEKIIEDCLLFLMSCGYLKTLKINACSENSRDTCCEQSIRPQKPKLRIIYNSEHI
jgi:hypothetical protein